MLPQEHLAHYHDGAALADPRHQLEPRPKRLRRRSHPCGVPARDFAERASISDL
jgi:hypothetical protein